MYPYGQLPPGHYQVHPNQIVAAAQYQGFPNVQYTSNVPYNNQNLATAQYAVAAHPFQQQQLYYNHAVQTQYPNYQQQLQYMQYQPNIMHQVQHQHAAIPCQVTSSQVQAQAPNPINGTVVIDGTTYQICSQDQKIIENPQSLENTSATAGNLTKASVQVSDSTTEVFIGTETKSEKTDRVSIPKVTRKEATYAKSSQPGLKVEKSVSSTGISSEQNMEPNSLDKNVNDIQAKVNVNDIQAKVTTPNPTSDIQINRTSDSTTIINTAEISEDMLLHNPLSDIHEPCIQSESEILQPDADPLDNEKEESENNGEKVDHEADRLVKLCETIGMIRKMDSKARRNRKEVDKNNPFANDEICSESDPDDDDNYSEDGFDSKRRKLE